MTATFLNNPTVPEESRGLGSTKHGWFRQHYRKLITVLLALALAIVSLQWVTTELALADAEDRVTQRDKWLEQARRRPDLLPVATPPCPSCSSAVCPPLPPPPPAPLETMCSGERRLPNGICLSVEMREGDDPSYEIVFAFHRPEGGWAYKKMLTDSGMRSPELAFMGLNEFDWKFLRASIPKPCLMALAPCETAERLETVNGVMTSLWQTTDTAMNVFACTSLDWRETDGPHTR